MKHVIHLTIESTKEVTVVRDGVLKVLKEAGADIIAVSYDTPRELFDVSPMPFGKHKGTVMSQVPREYLDWLVTQDWVPGKWPQVVDYVKGLSTVKETDDDEIPF